MYTGIFNRGRRRRRRRGLVLALKRWVFRTDTAAAASNSAADSDCSRPGRNYPQGLGSVQAMEAAHLACSLSA